MGRVGQEPLRVNRFGAGKQDAGRFAIFLYGVAGRGRIDKLYSRHLVEPFNYYVSLDCFETTPEELSRWSGW